MEITAETSVQDVLDATNENQRALMSRLAMVVFNRFSGGTIRAFTQFGFKELGVVIEAHRKSVFDYGAVILATNTGFAWPKDTRAVLHAIEAAEAGDYGSIDLDALGLVDGDGNPKVDLQKVFPGMPEDGFSRPAQQQTEPEPEPVIEEEPDVEEPPLPPEPEAKVEVEPELQRQVIPMRRPEPAPEPQPSAPMNAGDEVQAIIDRIDKLSNGMADAFETVVGEVKKIDLNRASVIEDEIGYVKNEVENTKAGILGLFGVLEVMDRNMRKVQDFIVGEGVLEFEDLPRDAISMVKLAVPEDIDERLEDDSGSVTTDPQDNEVVETNGQDTSSSAYTREQLEAMDVPTLRNIAAEVGAEPARWAKTNVNRILEAQARAS
jgi:hypothetical protein